MENWPETQGPASRSPQGTANTGRVLPKQGGREESTPNQVSSHLHTLTVCRTHTQTQTRTIKRLRHTTTPISHTFNCGCLRQKTCHFCVPELSDTTDPYHISSLLMRTHIALIKILQDLETKIITSGSFPTAPLHVAAVV